MYCQRMNIWQFSIFKFILMLHVVIFSLCLAQSKLGVLGSLLNTIRAVACPSRLTIIHVC